MNQDERLVYTLIKQSDDKGIWTRELRTRANLQQVQLQRILRALETRKIVKSLKSVESKNKKIYMLFEIEPSRQVTGGAWYNEQEFDSEFLGILRDQTYRFIAERVRGVFFRSFFFIQTLLSCGILWPPVSR